MQNGPFWTKIIRLCEKHNSDNAAINKIEASFNQINGIPHTDTYNYEERLSGLQSINDMCSNANVPLVFPDLDKLDRAQIIKDYICGLSDETIKNRRR